MPKINHFPYHGKGKPNSYFIHFTKEEAIELIADLARQINKNDPNTNRVEWMSENAKEDGCLYFSCCVDPDPTKYPYKKKEK